MRKYETISIDLKKRIENGEFEETKKLPTGGQLMKEYDASKNTISNAINLLVNDGLLFAIHGSGFYIRKPNKGTIKLNNTIGFSAEHPGEKLERDILSFKLIDCDTDLAEHLECKVGTPVYAIKRLMYIDDIPFLLNILTITKTSFLILIKTLQKHQFFLLLLMI